MEGIVLAIGIAGLALLVMIVGLAWRLSRAESALERERAHGSIALESVRERLAANDAKLLQLERDRMESFGRLMQEVAGVATASERLRSETALLSRALHGTNTRGSWGELQLRRACELAGMIEHCDFVTQPTVQTDDGGGLLRPDVIVKLPANRTIVIDAKAPAAAFLEAAECENEALRTELLAVHAAHVRRHVDLLSKKSYWEQCDGSPDFVVLFLANEALYSSALQHDPGLLEYAVQQRVLLATPVSLIGLLKVIALGWRQERIAESAQQVSEAGRELYERLRVLTEHFARLGSSLEKSVESYNAAVGSIERSVFPQARKFEQLGASGVDAIAPVEQVEVLPRALAAADWDDSTAIAS